MNLAAAALQVVSHRQWRHYMVPDHPGWAKNVLLIFIWMFVIAVLVGPLYRYFRGRKRSNARPAAW